METLNRIKNRFLDFNSNREYRKIYEEFKEYTMIPQEYYLSNLVLANCFKKVEGAMVECGVWRGGMSAGIAKLFADEKDYYLFDSFEGLPPAGDIDGQKAIKWQREKTDPTYFNNCAAEITFAQQAMKLSEAKNVHVIKGWFKETLPKYKGGKIAILRLDGDWYDSTMECLTYLFPHVAKGGVIILDDYYSWEGCAKALHDYLSEHKLNIRIKQFNNKICYLVKTDA
jgi:O-methyltransferase